MHIWWWRGQNISSCSREIQFGLHKWGSAFYFLRILDLLSLTSCNTGLSSTVLFEHGKWWQWSLLYFYEKKSHYVYKFILIIGVLRYFNSHIIVWFQKTYNCLMSLCKFLLIWWSGVLSWIKDFLLGEISMDVFYPA